MSLVKKVWTAWNRIGADWGSYLSLVGLDLAVSGIEAFYDRLLGPVQIDFNVPGMEELCRDTRRGIEPGDPARSLLYHVLASPHVVPEGIPAEMFPDFIEIEQLENLIYSIARPTVADLRLRAGGDPLAIGVFAYEYAAAIDTVHGRHADFCFSRTGIGRIGTLPPHYERRARGFFPYCGEHPDVHVVPVHYGVFIAVLRTPNRLTFGPEDFQAGDEDRRFYVPLHKLFDGPDCIDRTDIRLEISVHQVNEKIRRLHLALEREGVDTGWSLSDLAGPPFRITEDLAHFDRSQGLLIPRPHALTEPATTPDGRLVSFPVPVKHARLARTASLWFPANLDARSSPEFVHATHQLRENGEIVDLRKKVGVSIEAVLDQGGYQALNYVDHTADGWIVARCPALGMEITKQLPAYSVVSQPDFFPLVKQRDLFNWWQTAAPKEIAASIWPDTDVRPSPLSSSRLPANIALEGNPFDSTDGTITAIVGSDRGPGATARILQRGPKRESTLSNRATNFFDPGWDLAQDFNRDAASLKGTYHLASYGLGSPYMEDTVLCAALGSYWPGAVPDTTRMFAPHVYPSVTPLADRDLGFDGAFQPRAEEDGTTIFGVAEYTDYVDSVVDGRLSYNQFANISLEEYIARTLAMARVYQHLGASTRQQRAAFLVQVFRPAQENELEDLRHAKDVVLERGHAWYLQLAPFVSQKPIEGRFDIVRVTSGPAKVFLIDFATIAQRAGDAWDVTRF